MLAFHKILTILIFAYIQNISFSIVSRARNRDNQFYHAGASILSNLVWFMTFRILVVDDMSWYLLTPYLIGTVAGSLTGSKVSMWIERKIGAKT